MSAWSAIAVLTDDAGAQVESAASFEAVCSSTMPVSSAGQDIDLLA
jgi:hypothetical protein